MIEDRLHMNETLLDRTYSAQNILRFLHRQKMLVFGVMFLGTLSTFLWLQTIKPVYTATAQIVFEDKSSTFIKTQEARIYSPQIAYAVMQKLNLINDPYFNQKSGLSKQNPKFKTINPYKTELNHLSNKIIAQELEPVITRFQNNLSTQFLDDSYVLNLAYRDVIPQRAADILRNIMDFYLQHLGGEIRTEKHQNELRILEHLKENAEKSKQKLKHFKSVMSDRKKETRFISVSSASDYEGAHIKYAEARAKLRPFLDVNGHSVLNDKAPEILNSQIVQKLKLEKAHLEQRLDRLSTRYGSKHPQIIMLKSQISKIQDDIVQESRAIIERVQSEHDRAFIQLQTLEKPGEYNSQISSDDSTAQEQLKILQDQVQENLRLYEGYKTVYEKYKLEEQPLSAQILSQPMVPDTPSFPNKVRILSIGFMLSSLLGIFLALFIEKTRNSFLSGKQLEDYLGLSCSALIPRAQNSPDTTLSSYVVNCPTSDVSEAVRALRLSLKLRGHHEKKECKVVTLTSSFPDEGKTTLATWLGQLSAKSGERVILLDADLRRPRIHTNFRSQNTVSLVDYLNGKRKLETVINTDDLSGLHIIYGNAVPGSALDLLSSDKMEQLIRSLRKAYDLVIIDSPACLAVPDACALGKFSDQLLYIVSWNKTPREIVHNGILQFSKFKNVDISTVLTNIDLKKHVQFGYGRVVNYYNQYRECAAI